MAKMYRKLAPCGGDGGHEWDDDVYEGIRKVYVGQAFTRITYVKFEYVKENGEVVTREYGTISFQPEEFSLDPDEHIIELQGRCHHLDVKEVITALFFKTSKGKMSPLFGPKNVLNGFAGTEFLFFDGGNKIVGFHGRSGNAIDALGVYFAQNCLTTPFPLYKLEAQGGTKGRVWDNGYYDGVKMLRVGEDNCRITYLEFEYEKGEETETHHHGVKGEALSEFVLDCPDEYIISVEATYHKPSLFRNTVISSLKFETSKGRTSIFGYKVGTEFVLKQKDCKLVGFHGMDGDAIDALGAYFAKIPTLTPYKKLPSVGGNGGVIWDDGVYDGVRTIYIGQCNDCLSFVKFVYIKGTNLVSGEDHGTKTLLGVEELVLEDGEYITVLEGCYGKILRVEEPVILSLRFKTNKRESALFGMDSGEKFSLGQNCYKIIGFHGQASDVIHSVGVTIMPITTTK